MEKYLGEALKHLERNVEVVEKSVVALQNFQAARIIVNYRKNRGIFRKPGEVLQIMVFYSIKLKTKFWDFFFATTPARADEEIPVFDQCMYSVMIRESGIWRGITLCSRRC
jgi:hypothetical protein